MALRGAVHGSSEPGVPSEAKGGLFRYELAGAGHSVAEVFSGLSSGGKSTVLAETAGKRSLAARLLIDRTQGHGSWDFYRLDQDLFVVTCDFIYDDPRQEILPGEGFLEFSCILSGKLRIWPGERSEALLVDGPSLLLWYQAPGFATRERIEAGSRETSVHLYVRPAHLAALLEQNAISRWPFGPEMTLEGPPQCWYRILPVSANLAYVAKMLVDNTYQGGMRLMYAEAQALALLCEIIRMVDTKSPDSRASPLDADLLKLDQARRILSTQFTPVPKIPDIARSVGLSESKLKAEFKARFGSTVFDFGLGCRMQRALQLLRGSHTSVTEVAYEVGYSHPTTFCAAFRRFYGFLPRQARNERG